ncbi:MAG: SUMF1/EgtB/PvdO family nonheme iron enzyme [Myxococcota bacterium]
MTPDVAQLAALVPLDPTTLVLLTVALLPARITPRAFAFALRRPAWLPALLLVLAVASLALPVLPWPAIALLNLGLFLEAFRVATHASSSAHRWGTLVAIAGAWSLQTFRTFWQTFFEPDGRAHFWFVDFFNKLYLALIDPLLAEVGGPPARHAVIAYLTEPVAFFSNHLLAMHLMASFAAVVALTHVVTGRLNAAREEALTAPQLFTARLPKPWALAALGTLLLTPWVTTHWTVTVARELGGAALVGQGLLCAWVMTASSRLGRILSFAGVLVVCLHPHLMAIIAVVGLGDSLGGWRERALRHPERQEAAARRSAAWVRTLRRSFGPAILLMTLVPLLTFPLIPLSHRVKPTSIVPLVMDAHQGSATRGATVSIAASRVPAFEIDRFEHPNEEGNMPTTGLSPREAEAQCAKEGKVLCDSVGWYEACSNHGDRFYLVTSYPYQASALSRLRRECNLRSADGPGAMMPSGAMARCHGAYGVSDLAGNAYEWVRVPELQGFWGLAGSYYGYSDAQTPSCGFRVLIHEAQLGVIDRGATGFRCCK